MIGRRSCALAVLAILMTLGASAVEAGVRPGETAGQTAFHAMKHPRHHGKGVRHVHRHAQLVALIAHPTPAPRAADTPPGRPAPTPHRSHRGGSASLARGGRHASGSRFGPRHAAAVPAAGAWHGVATRTPDPTRNLTPNLRVIAVTGSRGPPRASPAGPSRGRASTAPAPADPDADPVASSFAALQITTLIDRSAGRSSARDGSLGPPAPSHSEADSRRLHVARREGATACLIMPSIGGSACPASRRFSRWLSRSVS